MLYLNKWSVFISILLSLGCAPKHEPVKSNSVKDIRKAFSSEGLLRKTSLHIRGVMPEAQDYKALSGLNSLESKSLINEKAKSYIQSETHKYKMILRLQELFQLKLSDPYGKDSFVNYVFDTMEKNISWDELYTGKTLSLIHI